MHIDEYSAERLVALLPHPVHDANKYTRGKLVFVGGAAQYPGAAALAIGAAQRMGAGYVEAYCDPSAVSVVRSTRLSAVVRPWNELSWPDHPSSAKHPWACLMGSGMDATDALQKAQVLEALAACTAPLVLDGGALGSLACEAGCARAAARADRGESLVLTPHGGEAARLAAAAGIQPPDADAGSEDRAAFACELACAWGATVLLKGPVSFIVSPRNPDRAIIMRYGTPALAKAGTGAVLAGMVGALRAQGMGATEACVLGATLHAQAARCAEKRWGDIAVIAEDVLACLGEATLIL